MSGGAGPVPDDVIDAVYDALAVDARDGCCADRRKACPECARYLDGVEAVFADSEVAGAFADAALLAKVRETCARYERDGLPGWGEGLHAELTALFDGGDRP